MDKNKQWIDLIVELQSLAQAGLTYGKDVYDKERYERIRDISAEMMAELSGLQVEKVKDLFCNETGYQTPKIDTRAAIFKEGKILLVHENNGTWSLPGGWCDVNVSVTENTIKEVKEEAGVRASIVKYIGKSQYNFTVPEDMVNKEVHWYLMSAGSYYSKPQREEYFVDSGYYKYHEAYHLLKFSNEKKILERAYNEYLNLKRDNLWGIHRINRIG